MTALACKTYVIAEAGVNHNGSLDLAQKLVHAANAAGADAVKFQTFRADALASSAAPKAAYQARLTDAGESQLEMLRKLELSPEAHHTLLTLARELGLEFLSTPFDLGSLELLDELGLTTIKLPSGEITNAPLLFETAQRGKKIILSTGMSTLSDIEDALSFLALGYLAAKDPPSLPPSLVSARDAYTLPEARTVLETNVTLLHCTTEYPAPFADVNLLALGTLRAAFGLRIGFSDHTRGLAVPVAAVALGAQVVEKHLTLDRTLPGPDHKASLEPAEFAELVTAVRQVEQALGSPVKLPAVSERPNRAVARKSLVAAAPIRAGEPFTEANLTLKRPGTGVSPIHFYDYLGRTAHRDFAADEVICD